MGCRHGLLAPPVSETVYGGGGALLTDRGVGLAVPSFKLRGRIAGDQPEALSSCAAVLYSLIERRRLAHVWD